MRVCVTGGVHLPGHDRDLVFVERDRPFAHPGLQPFTLPQTPWDDLAPDSCAQSAVQTSSRLGPNSDLENSIGWTPPQNSALILSRDEGSKQA